MNRQYRGRDYYRKDDPNDREDFSYCDWIAEFDDDNCTCVNWSVDGNYPKKVPCSRQSDCKPLDKEACIGDGLMKSKMKGMNPNAFGVL